MPAGPRFRALALLGRHHPPRITLPGVRETCTGAVLTRRSGTSPLSGLVVIKSGESGRRPTKLRLLGCFPRRRFSLASAAPGQ
jgi:hypothetical protein